MPAKRTNLFLIFLKLWSLVYEKTFIFILSYTLFDNKERFYFVFSTSKNPVNRFETDTTNKTQIEWKTIYAVSIVLLVLVIIITLSLIVSKKKR